MAWTVDDPSKYFQVALYSGTGATQSITNDGNSDMQPDLVWIKQRSGTENNIYFDSTRGAEKGLLTDANNTETTYNSSLTSFDSDGFTLGTSNAVNGAGTFAAWNWKSGGGSTSTNTDGDINSTVQVDTNAGLSIVTYSPTDSTPRTIGHGLGENPGMIWLRNRNKLEDTLIWLRTETGGVGGFYLNSVASYNPTSTALITSSSSTTFGVGTNVICNGNYNYVAYCWAEKQGYSKFGMYHGNGEANNHGPFIYCGFRPAMVVIKYASSSAQWVILDDKRPGYNPINARLFPSQTTAESTSQNMIDVHSNGFQVLSTDLDYNTENGRYAYWAFAEHPFVTSTGIPTPAT